MTKITILLWFCAVLSAAGANFLGSKWTMTVRVVDGEGKPLSGAKTEVWYHAGGSSFDGVEMEKISGKSDTNGFFVASKRSSSFELLYTATNAGYYAAGGSHELGPKYDPVRWNPTSTLVLKKIVNPIPMYAKRVRSDVPAFDKPVGYDLSAGDWVAPYGKGQFSDMLFTVHLEERAKHDWDHKLTVTFPNPGDGIQAFAISSAERSSNLKSPHQAPETGYQPQWVKTRSQRPNQAEKWQFDENLKFFIRVRTTLDEQGNVKSAHYGKIYGDFMGFRYFLNPTPNSRNIEFEPKKNLLQIRLPSERVKEP